MLQDVHGQLQQFVASGGIDIGSVEMAVLHLPNASARCGQRIDADKLGLAARQPTHQHLSRAERHAVVLSENTVNLAVARKDALHCPHSALFRPVTGLAVDEPHARMAAQGVDESAMAVDGWRRLLQTAYLHQVAFLAKDMSDIFTHDAADLIVVGAHESRIVGRFGLAVEEHHWDSFLVGPLDGWSNGVHLIGRDDEQVHAAVDEAVDLLLL